MQSPQKDLHNKEGRQAGCREQVYSKKCVLLVQAVHMLHEEVGSLSEGSCGDMLVLPIYAALPPELQACCTSPFPLICHSHTSHDSIHFPPSHRLLLYVT